MNSVLPIRKKSNNWAIIHYMGSYRAVTNEAAIRERNLYGYDIVHRDLTVSCADEWLTAYRTAQTPVLTDLFIYDHSAEGVEARPMEDIQEYDVISAQCSDGIYRTGSVISWNSRTVRMEVGNVIYRARVNTATLIAKVDDAIWNEDEPESWTVEYDEYRDETDEPYEIQTAPTVAA